MSQLVVKAYINSIKPRDPESDGLAISNRLRFAPHVGNIWAQWHLPESDCGAEGNRSAERGIAPESILLDYGAALVIAWVVKNSLSTAPILMYQHSRSGVSMPGI